VRRAVHRLPQIQERFGKPVILCDTGPLVALIDRDSHFHIYRIIDQEASSSGRELGSRLRTTRAGTPAANTRAGIGLVTTAPAPTTESQPTSAMMTAPLPIQVPAPMRICCSNPGWS